MRHDGGLQTFRGTTMKAGMTTASYATDTERWAAVQRSVSVA
jgi:hypothetical protein